MSFIPQIKKNKYISVCPGSEGGDMLSLHVLSKKVVMSPLLMLLKKLM